MLVDILNAILPSILNKGDCLGYPKEEAVTLEVK